MTQNVPISRLFNFTISNTAVIQVAVAQQQLPPFMVPSVALNAMRMALEDVDHGSDINHGNNNAEHLGKNSLDDN